MQGIVGFVKKLITEIKEDNATGLAAEQAYYYMLSLFPMLILLLSIIPYLSLDANDAINVLESAMPAETADIFKENVVQFINNPNGGLLTIGILGTLWSASNGMNAFMRAMNEAYNVKETRSFIKVRGLSILLTIGLILTLVIALILPVFGGVILKALVSWGLPTSFGTFLSVLRWIVAITIMIAVLSMLYRLAPNKKFPFAHVWPGAVAATLLWQLTSLGFSFYVSNFGNYSATYGSLGGVIVLMLWLFLTGLILVIGGEINAIYHQDRTISPVTKNDEITVN
ncbi:YihY/virulence factor BrkB family protein [Priestia flexa]|uniref:YihY/virulence factor BrkB family protein n=2 Tax=Priestia flexa TaxID=86664 RepID=UPI002E23DDD1|nr:YihY/virulence factor BrkB family protein [Priestia flexa]